MIRSVPRRTILASLAGLPALALLASCSDSGGGQVPAAEAAPATPAPAAPTPATPAAAAPAPSGKVDMAKLLEEGALPDKTIGNADAPVTIVEYASMTCSHCATFHVETLPAIKEKYIDTGKARLVFREFPFDPRAEAGFMLARCAGDNYFPMIDVLFRQQMNWAAAENVKDAMFQLAKLAGFTQESFNACLTDQNLLDQVRAVQKRGAEEFRIDSTPTFIINGKVYKGAMSIDEFSAVIDPLL
jgi:protein-disulfide isomerase